MKKIYLRIILVVITATYTITAHAQGIYQFWGVTNYGGPNDDGVLFSAKYDGSGVSVRHAFVPYTPGNENPGQDMIVYNNKMYGVMPWSGLFSQGIIYEFDPAANTYTKLADLHSLEGSDLQINRGRLVAYNNRLYGVATLAGFDTEGYLYELDLTTKTLTVKHHFNNANGRHPQGGLTLYNNKLYGVAANGGANNFGVIFSYDLATNTYTKLYDFSSNMGLTVFRDFELFNNRFYFTTVSTGNNNAGALYEFNPATNQLALKAHFDAIGASQPRGALLLHDNKLYGGTVKGGTNDAGVIYEYNPATNTLLKKYDLTIVGGSEIFGRLMVFNNKLYGLTSMGGTGDGALFEFDIVNNTYTKKVNFGSSFGTNPQGGLTAYNNRLYGWTNMGGAYNQGVLFEYNPAVNSYTKKIELGHSDGHSPAGALVYYNGKIYGTTWNGGNNNRGVIYAYDPVTRQYSILFHMSDATGFQSDQGGFLLHNHMLYGVAALGGNNGSGVLFRFDPQNNQYTVLHHFSAATGNMPRALPIVYNNKLYGVTSQGGSNNGGVLYEYDLITNSYSAKVNFGGSFGRLPYASLIEYNGKLYGVTRGGGNHEGGTLFEFTPGINGFAVHHHFSLAEGSDPETALVLYNNMLWGTTSQGGAETSSGTIYVFNPANNMFVKKYDVKLPDAQQCRTDLIVHNNKLYGMANGGGDVRFGGTLFEYDANHSILTNKSHFDGYNGRSPRYNRLLVLPAFAAPGTPGSCEAVAPQTININNNNTWVPFTDEEGNAVAEIYAHGNLLGNVSISFYTHDGTTRKDMHNRYYLDRNITISVSNPPNAPVSVRLYIRKSEFEALKNTPGAGITSIDDLAVFKNDDPCGKSVDGNATPVPTTVEPWGQDYVLSFQVTGFSTFYIANKAYTSLPVKLEYFKGAVADTWNELTWKASCTQDTRFIVERSTDGVTYAEIGEVKATPAQCAHPHLFKDEQPQPGKSWYRLRMEESDGSISYSQVVLLTRESAPFRVQVVPNPVTGNVAAFSILSPEKATVPVHVYDMNGRALIKTQWQIETGLQTRQVSVQQIPAGTYQVVLYYQGRTITTRMVKQ